MSLNITFLGVGLMGAPMVSRLLADGYSLTLWNRTRAKAEAFAADARIANDPVAAVTGADIVITMLETGPVVEQVLFESGADSALKAGATVIDMSSIPPAMARDFSSRLRSKSVCFLDAPVSGGTVGAEQGTLAIMVGGERETYDAMEPLFKVFGKSTYIGPQGAGQLAKLANQAIVGITIGAVSEALLLAEQGGADPVAVREALMGGFAASRILDLHGQRMIERRFEPGATARVQLKDLRTILDEARAEGLSLPLSQRVYESYLALANSGHEGVDHSGLLLQLEALNGCKMASSDASHAEARGVNLENPDA
ncbi:MAG: NAD(P)-dependent oxidoreductase [Pseudomonadales bacterium]|nr:NAD(P)-dependent oxidoreductase [Pseudomonadales bacterium]